MAPIENLASIFTEFNLNSLKLSKEEIDYIKLLLSDSPELFKKIEDNINIIIKDDKLDIHDIPQLILLITSVVKIDYKNMNKKIDIINVIEYIINTIIESGILPLPQCDVPVVKNIIFSSLELLRTNTNIKKSFFNCFSCCK